MLVGTWRHGLDNDGSGAGAKGTGSCGSNNNTGVVTWRTAGVECLAGLIGSCSQGWQQENHESKKYRGIAVFSARAEVHICCDVIISPILQRGP
jgi:hypothetical protein